MAEIAFTLNGAEVRLTDPDPTMTLLDWLREVRGLTGTKEGCNEGDCGACTVEVVGREAGAPMARPMNACILFLPQLHGKAVTTVEGVGSPEALHDVQRAMVECHGSQCGFCTPGIVMSLYTAQRSGRRDWDDVLAGNLCRCTGYAPIARAAEALSPAAVTPDCPAPPAGALDWAGAYLPEDLDAFAEWYAAHPGATLVAGATDVGLWVTKALRDVRPVAFLHRLSALQGIVAEPGGLRIGAGVTVERLIPVMAERHPALAEILRRYGSVQVRSAATIGGNIANGSPIGDSPPPLIALGARLRLRRGATLREMPLEDFFLAYGHQDRAAGEFVESVFLPDQPDRLRAWKISKRFDQDISALLGAFSVSVEDGHVADARIAFGGMAGTPKRARAVEAVLIGAPWTAATVAAGQRAMAEDFQPIDDMRASAAYRLRVAENLLARVFYGDGAGLAQRAVQRAIRGAA